jgi:hypothetical protein
VILALVGIPAAAPGQEDFRNADPGRPIRIEDAYPIKYREWEVLVGVRPELREGGPSRYVAMSELKTGIYYDLELGLEVQIALRSGGGVRSEFGREEVGFHALYNLNVETRSVPALGARADVLVPTGGALGRDRFGWAVKGLATRSFGRLRLHGNLGHRFSYETDADIAADPLEGDVWLAGLAFDYPIGLFSRMVLGDVYVEVPARGGRTAVVADLGARIQVGNRWVLDLGVGSTVSEWDEALNGSITVGLTRGFGVPWLVSVPPYQEPTVDR